MQLQFQLKKIRLDRVGFLPELAFQFLALKGRAHPLPGCDVQCLGQPLVPLNGNCLLFQLLLAV